jgi:hypothetical protein
MLAIIPLSSTSLTSRGVFKTCSQSAVSSRSPLRMASHSVTSTADIFHGSSHFASAKGLPPSLAQRFISDNP